MKRWVTWVDAVTAVRIPLAALFPLLRDERWQLGAVAAAAASDFFDGLLARRVGSSRVGAVLDPVADKLFAAVTFLAVARWGMLHPIEVLAVLGRDILAVLGFLGTALLRRPVALPARAGGKAVTVGQFLTLVAAIAGSPLVRSLAWATAAVGLYAIWDYGRVASHARASARGEGKGEGGVT